MENSSLSGKSLTVFITGATGNLGGRMATDLLAENPAARVVALARGESAEATRSRVLQAMALSHPEFDPVRHGARLTVVRGDITRTDLGLPHPLYRRLVRSVTHIIHAAATTRFDLPLECARVVNESGTRHVLHLARRAAASGKLRHMAHISTAYVCGVRQGQVFEDVAERPGAFANTYEETKWCGEHIARNFVSDVPLSIVRPSIVVGDSRHGRIAALNVLYVPLRLICRGLAPELPGEPGATLDVVPVDYVSRAIRFLTLSAACASGTVFHVVAGPEQTCTVDHIVRRTLDFFRATCPVTRVRYVHPCMWPSPKFGAPPSAYVRRVMALYQSYLGSYRWFDDTRARAALAPAGIRAPALDSYFDRVLEFCAATGWGRSLKLAA